MTNQKQFITTVPQNSFKCIKNAEKVDIGNQAVHIAQKILAAMLDSGIDCTAAYLNARRNSQRTESVCAYSILFIRRKVCDKNPAGEIVGKNLPAPRTAAPDLHEVAESRRNWAS